MPSIRRHVITGEPIVFAPERAERPNAFGDEEVGVCPFCPGNESLTPPEIARTGEPWQIRVFPNKYPSVDGHEVIVESPDHSASLGEVADPAEVVRTYQARYRSHRDAPFVALFSNSGRRAGASIDHVHSQLMPLPFLPPRVAAETRSFGGAARCPLCDALDTHRDDDLTIAEDAFFARLAPRGSSHAYEQWIVATHHRPEMVDMPEEAVESLGSALRDAVRAARRVSSSYNVVFMNFRGEQKAHFYVAVIPRLAAVAGFELATGTFIDIIDPAAAARALR